MNVRRAVLDMVINLALAAIIFAGVFVLVTCLAVGWVVW